MTHTPSPQLRSREPWVNLATGAELEGWSAEDAIIYNQQNRQMQKSAFFVNAFDLLSENGIVGDYHEYGCHHGRTFRMALTEARRHLREEMRFYAFDSFHGLPQVVNETRMPTWRKGAMQTSEEEFRRLIADHGIYVEHCEIIKGFFQETLTRELQVRMRSTGRRIALVCIDCDLYESSVPAFRFIEPLLQDGTLLYIDDFFVGYAGSPLQGVSRAFREFEQTSRFRFVPHMQVGWWGRSFIAYRDDTTTSRQER